MGPKDMLAPLSGVLEGHGPIGSPPLLRLPMSQNSERSQGVGRPTESIVQRGGKSLRGTLEECVSSGTPALKERMRYVVEITAM